jgi:hypothetical protein
MDHRDSYSAFALCNKDEELGDKTVLTSEAGGSDTSPETRLEEEDSVEEDNVIVEIDSEVDSDDEAPLLADGVLVVVPETEEAVAVIAPETQETVMDLLPHEVVNPCPNRAEFKYGGFPPPTLSEGNTYSSYSQFASQFSDHDCHTCLHVDEEWRPNAAQTAWCGV